MTRKIILNPKYQHLQDFVVHIPETFLSGGECIYDARNKIKVFQFNGLKLNVKRYCIPIIFNRLAYLYLRRPKAVRAYEYALKLNALHINTPDPVAYIIEKEHGLLSYSYFISLQVPYSHRFYEFGHATMTPENISLLETFGHFTARLHQSEVYHQDYSPGNILFDLQDGKPEFCIVDINRMNFGPVSFRKGCANFARLWGPKEMFGYIARGYASERGYDEKETLREILQSRRQYWQKAIRKHPAEFPLEL